MKIGYYFSHIDPNYGGIYQYALLVLKMLVDDERIEKITLFYSNDQKEVFKEYFNHDKVEMKLFDRKGKLYLLKKRIAEFFMNRYYLTGKENHRYINYYKTFHPDIRFFDQCDMDVFQVPMQLSPVYHLKCPVITTMHDLQQMYFPEFFTPQERMYKSISYYMALEESDHVLVSYNHVKKDIVKYFRLDPSKVSVCLDPATIDWFYQEDYPDYEALHKKYGIPEKFILTPAATWEHKNHINVLKALAILKKKGKEVFWVATGRKHPYYYDVLEPEIKALELESQVLFPGMVPDEDLIGLFHLAALSVIPTLYEAGSGPLFESWRYKVPTICSNATTIPEHMDNDQFIFDPLNPESIAALIDKGMFDESFRKESRENNERRLNDFSKIDFMEDFMKMYEYAIKQKQL